MYQATFLGSAGGDGVTQQFRSSGGTIFNFENQQIHLGPQLAGPPSGGVNPVQLMHTHHRSQTD